MKIYSLNNPAKQWMLEEILRLSDGRPLRVCDIGCGAGSVWPGFLREHPHVTYVGIDTDAAEIERARTAFGGCPNASVRVADGQAFTDGAGTYDVVTAFSALEHVVNIPKFVATSLALLRPGGRALLNYDAGHFRSHDVKERVMVPVSQLLAKVGVEGPYMREVDDEALKKDVAACGGKMVTLRKHGLHALKQQFRGPMLTEDIARAWCDFENRMNELVSPEMLDPVFWSTVAVIERA